MRLLVILLSCFALTAPSQTPEQTHNSSQKIVIVAEKKSAKIQYVINGVRLAPKQSFLRAASDQKESKGTGARTFLVVPENFTVSDIQNTVGILSKAGLDSVRIFGLNRDKTGISELVPGKSYLFDPSFEALTPMHCGNPCPSTEIP